MRYKDEGEVLQSNLNSDWNPIDNPCCLRPRRLRYKMLLPSLLLSSLNGVARIGPQLRISNDINIPSELAMSASRNGTHAGLIAAVERGPSEGARSGST